MSRENEIRHFDEAPRLTAPQRTFIIRGERFVRRERVRAEASALIEDAAFVGSSLEVVRMLNEGIEAFLEDADVVRWRRLRGLPMPLVEYMPPLDDEGHPRADADLVPTEVGAEPDPAALADPITLHEMQQIGAWLLEVETGIPTAPPSPSGNGADGTEATSREPSEPQEATQAA